jgi:hypothetical protein
MSGIVKDPHFCADQCLGEVAQLALHGSLVKVAPLDHGESELLERRRHVANVVLGVR